MESNGVGSLVLNDSWKVVPGGNWQWSEAVHITPWSLSGRRYPRWRKKPLKYIWPKPFPNGDKCSILNDSWKVVPRGNWQWSEAVHITPWSLSGRRYPKWRKKPLKYIWPEPFPNGDKCFYLKWNCQKLHTRNLLSYKKNEIINYSLVVGDQFQTLLERVWTQPHLD